MDSSLDFLSSVLDEISLEGLDGITLPTLWVRLKHRPLFPLALDDGSKSFIWECVAVHKDIEVYQLPDPRPVFEVHDRYEHIDPEFGLVTEPDKIPADIYPMTIIENGNIRGSCSTYETRICVTSQVRHGTVLLMSLSHVMEKWPDRMVLVASPKLRLLALLGTEVNPLLELTKEQYCLLERIGRSRYHGEVSQGEDGLLVRCVPLKAHLHYYFGKLLKKGLVTKQKHILRTKSGKTIQGSLFHLTRFYVQRKVKFDTLLECMYNSLKNKPNNREEYRKLQDELGLPLITFRKLLKRFAYRWFKIVLVPMKEMNPEASDEECVLKNGQAKQVKVVQMVHPYIEDEDHLTEDEEEDSKENPYFDPTKLYLDVPLIVQANKIVINSGPDGVTLKEMRKILTLPKLDVRAICRCLVKSKLVITVMQDRGRQRFEKYISKLYENQSSCMSIKEQPENFNVEKVAELDTKIQNKEPSNDNKLEHKNLGSNKMPVSVCAQNRSEISADFENIQSEIIELPDGGCLAGKVGVPGETNDRFTTSRILKRMNLISEHIKNVKLANLTELCRVVLDSESAEGYSFRADKRSVMRIIHRLCKSNHAKVYKVLLKLNDITKEFRFICHPSMEPTDSEFKTAVEEAKFKNFCTDKNVNKKGYGKKGANKDTSKLESNKKESQEVNNKENQLTKNYAPAIGRQVYGLQPKFVRTKALHIFLCYLVNFYEGTQEEELPGMYVYHDSSTWKRFVPPLPKSKRKGWCVLSDAISRMPLSIFVKIVNLRYEIHGLEDILQDPIKQHYLLKYLSQDLRNNLLSNRRYVFLTYEILQRLCHMGLASLGPKLRFEKDQVCIYIHQKARIKDTTISPSGYLQIDPNVIYEMKEYSFKSLGDVETYWIDLETICCHTPLGKYSVVAGQKIVILDPNQKPELMDAVKNHDYDGVVDNGEIPGDGVGAGGLDSSLYSHCRRNWFWPSFNYKMSVPQQKSDSASKANSSLQYLLKKGSKKIEHPESRVRLQRLTKQVLVPSRKRPHASAPSNTGAKRIKTVKVKKNKVRTVKHRVIKPRQPFYDEKDKAAIECMSTMKVSWSSQEDSFLLLCRVASEFLDPTCNRLVVPFTVVRDILQENFPKLAQNKTSRACQRRMRYMLVHSEETRYSVDVFLGEAKQDMDLVKEYDKVKPVKTKETEWRNMFSSLLDKLVKKFTSSNRQTNIVELPDTVQLLKSHYRVSYPLYQTDSHTHKEPKTKLDIYFSTITAFILSALSLMEEANKFSLILYRVYEQYPENILKDAIERLCKQHLITKKIYAKRPKLKECVHASSVPYRFTVTYENFLLLKYPTKVFQEAVDFINELKEGSTQMKDDIPAGCLISVVSFILLEAIKIQAEIPEQIIVFDTSFDERCRSAVVKNMMTSLNDEESCKLVNMMTAKDISANSADDGSGEQPKAKRPKRDEVQAASLLSEEMKDAEDENSSDASNICNSSRLAFYMLGDSLQKPKSDSYAQSGDYVSLNSCKLSCTLTSSATDIFSLEQSGNAATKESLDDIINSIISIHSCYVNPELMCSDNNYDNLCRNLYTKLGVTDTDLREGLEIFNTICSTETNGITYLELEQKFQNLKGQFSLSQHLKTLLASMLVLRVGVVGFCYVGVMHSKPWVVSSFIVARGSDTPVGSHDKNLAAGPLQPAKKNYITVTPGNAKNKDKSDLSSVVLHAPLEPAFFVPRTWRKPDGSLNGEVFIQMVRSVLCCIMSFPGITKEKICEKFSLPLQPVQTLELLEVLEQIQCIFMYYTRPPVKSSIFSPCKTATIIWNNSLPGDITHYEACSDAVVKIAKLSSRVSSLNT